MAHLVETMAYAGAAPWHKLGVPVDGTLTPEEMAIAAGIDWLVEKRALFVRNDNGGFAEVPDAFGLTRATDGKVLDVVGRLYKPVQNLAALDFFKRFTAAGDMTMETAGSLDGGRRIWGLAAIGQGFTLVGGDRVEGYLLLCSPHRQGEAFTVKLTAVRVVCNNTLTRAINGGGAAWRMSHVHAFDENAKAAAIETLGLAKNHLTDLADKAQFLSESRVREQQHLIEYVATLSGSKILEEIAEEAEATENGNRLDAVIAASVAGETVRAVRETDLNRVGRTILESILTSPGSELESARGTWWGAVNGVTHAVDHVIGRTDDSRLTSAWFGDRANLKQQAVELAVDYASKN